MVNIIIYISLIAIIILSLITGLVTTIIEQKDLKAQRTKVFKAIKEETEKRAAQEIVSNPTITQTQDMLDLTREIEILDFDDNDSVIKKYEDIEVL